MKRKIRILSTVATMALVATVMCVGIYAATRVDITGSGSITFTATDVYADVTITQGADEVYSRSFGKNDNPGAVMSETVDFQTFAIDPTTRQATVTITVKNNFDADTTAITATVTAEAKKDGSAYDGVTIDVSGEAGVTTVAAAGTETITVTIRLTDDAVKNGVEEGVTFEFTLSLERAA